MADPQDADEGFQEKAPAPRLAKDEAIQPPPAKKPLGDRDDDWQERDDRPRRRPPPRSAGDDAVSTIIPYKNGMALAAYYVGVFSLIPCLALILGPLGIIFGIVGLNRVKANPEVKGTGHAIAGIVLGGLTTLANVVVIVLIVVGAFAGRR
jgi:hypothetical protein